MNINSKIKNKLILVPNKPGSYQMLDNTGAIIYIGKTKNLQRRLKSYFNKTQTGKTLMLVNDIYDFEYIVTTSELESLILEITLIKKYNPKYNILLKDDKSYPYIEFNTEKYPELKIVRNIKRKKNKNKLFGPYPNVKAARTTVEILNRIYPLKKCNTMQKDVCLYFHLGECLGYCTKNNKNVDTLLMIKEITSFLNGEHKFITEKIKKDMNIASNKMNYERALELKQILEDIEITLSKQKIDLNNNDNFDLFTYYIKNNFLSIQVFFIRNGLLFGRHSDIFECFSDENDIFSEYIIKFYDQNNIIPKEIYVNDNDNYELLSNYLNTKVSVPKKGKIKKLLDMAFDNAKITLNEKIETMKNDIDKKNNSKLELQNLLNIKNLYRIEAFDNSHLFGTFYVGAMVVFENFTPNRSLYRKYKIDVSVKDDLSAMKEVTYRRYYRAIMENDSLPELIVIDGGNEQIKIVKEVINNLKINVKIIGLKKDEKHRTNTIIDENFNEIQVSNNLFIFLSKIQEEVHRFAITYHRDIKSKGMLISMLDSVLGIGEIRKKRLINHFGSIKKMKDATLEEFEKILTKDTAKKLYEFLKNIN